MRGLVLEDVGRVAYRTDLADPTVEQPTDAVVEVRCAGLCGSDLHPYLGRERVRLGVVCGHEAVGQIVAVGAEVRELAVGQRVLVPFTTSCGACGPCARGLTARCVRGELFGFGSAVDMTAPALHGAQAEYVRVPLADTTAVHVSDVLDEPSALLLTDNLPTAWVAAERTMFSPGDTVVVVGLGAVGQCAVLVALDRGAGRVVGVDPVAQRRDVAERLGAQSASPDDAPDMVDEGDAAGHDRGVPAVIDAAGTTSSQALAAALVRPGGVLSTIAVQTSPTFAFTPTAAYDTNLTVAFGRASVRAVLDRHLSDLARLARRLAPLVVNDAAIDLTDGPDAYRRFAERQTGMIKAAFVP